MAYFGVQAKSWQYQLSAIFVPSRRFIAFRKLILKLRCTSKMCPGKATLQARLVGAANSQKIVFDPGNHTDWQSLQSREWIIVEPALMIFEPLLSPNSAYSTT